MVIHGHTRGSQIRYLFDGQIVIGRQAVISRQAAMMGGVSWDEVVQKILTGHEQTRDADQSHMDPLVPSKTAHLSSAHCKAVASDPHGQVHDITVTVYSPGPADQRNPSFLFLCAPLESVKLVQNWQLMLSAPSPENLNQKNDNINVDDEKWQEGYRLPESELAN